MKRALRRHHEQRIKSRFLRREGKRRYWLSEICDDIPQHDRRVRAGTYAHHGCVCSCWMCGNPRRHLKERTLQERRHEYKLRD